MATAEHELASVLDALSHTGAPPVDDRNHAQLADHFETIYRNAQSDPSLIPWHRSGANPPLVAWLDAEAPSLVRPGASAVVVGCGLGEDVAELTRRGYDAVGFDICPTAIDWARKRHPDLADAFLIADAINPPHGMLRRFDLVVEIYTIQAVPLALRIDTVAGITSLLRPHGTLLTICRGRDHETPIDEADGTPYPISPIELRDYMADCGLKPTREIDDFLDDEDPPKRRLRAAFRHA
jgi:SAM-dependent methyltransferase